MMKTYVILDIPQDSFPTLRALTHTIQKETDKITILFLHNSPLLFKNRNFEETYNRLIEAGATLLALRDDVEARGIDLQNKHVKLVNYPEIIDLIMDQSSRVFNI